MAPKGEGGIPAGGYGEEVNVEATYQDKVRRTAAALNGVLLYLHTPTFIPDDKGAGAVRSISENSHEKSVQARRVGRT